MRPTADRVKEALFSILGSRVDLQGAAVLDVFAGSGALGIEALSRGAAAVSFVEHDPQARRALTANLTRCDLALRGRIYAQSAAAAFARLAEEDACFDGVLLDPPYGEGLVERVLAMLGSGPWLRPDGWVMAEHHVDDRLAEIYGTLRLTTTKRYGKTVLSLYRRTDSPDDMAET